MRKGDFRAGLLASIPVFVGYFSVSFGFGTLAAALGINTLDATLISFTNLTSAGQFAGLTVIGEAGSLLDMFITQLVINSRYALMSLSLGQRLGPRIGIGSRLAISFFNTDEIFALAMNRNEPLTTSYMVGLGVLPLVGWTGGTLLGSMLGSVLPAAITTALGVALYGMFVAIVTPQARANKSMLYAVVIAVVLSCLFTWMPVLNKLSSGLSIVLCTVVASAICAWFFPVNHAEEAEQ